MSEWRTVGLALRAALWTAGVVFGWWLAAGAVRVWDARLGGPLPAWWRGPGWAVVIVGGALVVWCLGLFVVRGRGTAAPFDPPRQFVAVGPYRRVRNPMYWGAAGVLGGAALIARSPAMLVLAAALLAGAHAFVVFVEEPGLERRFGDSYREYKRAVRRWLPIKG